MAERIAIDFSAAWPSPGAIKARGVEAVIAYVSEKRPSASWMGAKPLTRDRADALRAGGVEIVSNYQFGKENDPTPSDWRFGEEGGKRHARIALDNHFRAGGPGWRPCFAPVDANPSDSEIDQLVVPFLRGWISVWGVEWTGVYCNVPTWNRVKKAIPELRWFWQHDWDGNRTDHSHHPDATVHQVRIDKDKIEGIGIDWNVILRDDYGQWSKGGVDPKKAGGVVVPVEGSKPVVLPAPVVETFPITPYRMAEIGHYDGHSRRLRVYFHTSEGVDWKSTARGTADYQVATQTGSYHLLIDDAEIIQTVSLNDTAWGVLNDNGRTVQICLILSSGASGSGATAQEGRPKSPEQWAAHEKMLRMARFALAWVLGELARMGEPVPMERVTIDGVGRNLMGVSSHNNYTYGSVRLRGFKDGTHWDVPDTFTYDRVMGPQLPPDPDAFPLPGGYFYGPLDGPEESISGQAGEQRSWIDGLRRWQRTVGIPESGVWDGATSAAAKQLQTEKKWQRSPNGFVYKGEWDAVIREGWKIRQTPVVVTPPPTTTPPVVTPTPVAQTGVTVGMARKIQHLTGKGITDRWGIGCTDLGAMVANQRGEMVAVFGDTFADRVGGNDWRSPTGLFGDVAADGQITWKRAVGPDQAYAKQWWYYRHVARPTNGEISTVIPSDLLRVGTRLYLQAMVNSGFGNVIWTEMWTSGDDGQTWQHMGEAGKWDGKANLGRFQCISWDYDPTDSYVYIVGTGFQRDEGLVLKRCRPADLGDQSKWQNWGWNGSAWVWGTKDPSYITPAGEKWGEITLRKLDGGWVLGGFLASSYCLAYRVIDGPLANLHTAQLYKPVVGCDWGQEDHANGKVAQLYGGYVLPGSKLGVDGGVKLAVSQWNTATGSPYQVMQFAATLPTATTPAPAAQ